MYLYHILFVSMNICGIDCQKKKLLQNTDRKGSIQNEWSGHSSSSIHKGHGKVKEKQKKAPKEKCKKGVVILTKDGVTMLPVWKT
jgi:hypothetical protein